MRIHWNNLDYRKILEIHKQAPIPGREAENRTLELIRQQTHLTGSETSVKNRIKSFVRLNPILGAAAAALLVIAAVFSVLFSGHQPQNPNIPRFTVVSDLSGTHSGETIKLRFGDEMTSGSSFTTGRNEQLSLQKGDTIGIRLFENSELSLLEDNPERGTIFRLGKGSMYINKTVPPDKNGSFRVLAGHYSFTLVGTRVYLAVEDERIMAICYEGKVRIEKSDTRKSMDPESIVKGEKVVIMPDGSVFLIQENSWSVREKELDEHIRNILPYKQIYNSPLLNFSIPEKPPADRVPVSALNPEQDNPASKIKKSEPAWIITKLGELQDPVLKTQSTHIPYIATAGSGNRHFLLSPTMLTVLENGKLGRSISFADSANGESFKTKPVLAGKLLCIVSTRTIYLLNQDDLSIFRSIPVPAKGSISDNYFPVYSGKTLYIPVINKGYYTLNPGIPDGSPELVREEIFPLSPVIQSDMFYTGSFYDNHISSYTADNTLQWNYSVPGTSFSNFTVYNDIVYTYCLDNEHPEIIAISKGEKTAEWPLSSPVTADIHSAGDYLYSINNDGEIVCLNVQTGLMGIKARLFESNPGTSILRTLSPAVSGTDLFAGTSDGSLLIYGMKEGSVKEKIAVALGEQFFSTPILEGDIVFLVSISGKVYKIVKSDR